MNEPITDDQGFEQEEAVSSSENSAEINDTPDQSTVDHQDPESPDAINAELEQLRKQADHGNRKITELGQTKSMLQQELSSKFSFAEHVCLSLKFNNSEVWKVGL